MRRFLHLKAGMVTLFALLVVMMAASCGGGASSLTPTDSSTTGSTVSDARSLSSGAALPSLPKEYVAAQAKGASSVGTREYTGSGDGLLQYSNGTVEGDSLVLASTEDDMAWAIYKASDLTDLWVTTLGVEITPVTTDTTWYVALSNFTRGCWDWEIESTLPEIVHDLTQYTDRIVSPLGNMYWVVAIPKGNLSIKIDMSTIIAENAPDDPWRPGGGNFIFASQGLPGLINIQWGGVDGATSFELYRREASCDGRAPNGEFELLAVVPDVLYDDYEVTAGVPYEYKVRAINDNGYGAFSEVAMGWATDPNGSNPGGDRTCAFGEIIDYTDTSITIMDPCMGPDGVAFTINPDTVYFDIDGNAVDHSYFSIGMMAFVDGLFDAAGNLLASAVMEAPDDPGQPQDPRVLIGEIVALSETSIEIACENSANQTAEITVDTIWVDENGEIVDINSFAVGDMVAVMLDPNDPASNIAIAVQKLPPPPDGDDPTDPPGGGNR
jgi:hypothetical protein